MAPDNTIMDKMKSPALPYCVPVVANSPKRFFQGRVMPSSARTQQFIMLSSVYCQLLVVGCVVLLTSEVVTGSQPLLFFSEGFFMYLYASSLLFLVYVYLYLLRHGNRPGDVNSSPIGDDEFELRPTTTTTAAGAPIAVPAAAAASGGGRRPHSQPPPPPPKRAAGARLLLAGLRKTAARSGGSSGVDAADAAPTGNGGYCKTNSASCDDLATSETTTGTELALAGDAAASRGGILAVESAVVGGSASSGVASGVACLQRLDSTMAHLVKRRISENDRSHGSLFLRVGAIAFGLGTMVYNGLEFGSYFEIPSTSRCYSMLLAINPMLQLMFTFAQMYFIFMNARLNIHKFKVVARFGLMHMVATNICVWIRTLGKETLQEVLAYEITPAASNRTAAIEDAVLTFRSRGTLSGNRSETCERIDIMGSIVLDASPFLYPFIIEYSLISAAVLYVMWQNIGKDPVFELKLFNGNGVSPEDQLAEASAHFSHANGGVRSTAGSHLNQRHQQLHQLQQRQFHHRGVNCVGSSKGLFLGLLVLVCSTICLIVFFVLVQHKRYEDVAIYMSDVSHCGINVLTILAILAGFLRVRRLRFHPDRNDHLRSILLSVSSFGLYVYSVFGIVAGTLLPKDRVANTLLLATSSLTVVQVTLQSLFIADVTCRSTCTPEHDRTKPGRQIVTFLLISNLTLWIVYTFEMQKVEASPVQLSFYGFFAWTFIIRSSLPLSIFYRFHSSVTFAEVWKNSYREVEP